MYGHKDIRSRVFLQVLDILNQDSIQNLKLRLLENYGGIHNLQSQYTKCIKVTLISFLQIFIQTMHIEYSRP